MSAKGDVDLDTLQAQIDMSMSFAQSLVTSWIKPARLVQSSAAQALEDELRHPPRLGVGASFPMAPPLAHEGTKLRRRLEKNGAKNEAVVISLKQDPSELDDEHKGRPVKRKTKVDPFAHEGSKKRKRRAELEHNASPSIKNVSKNSISWQNDSNLRDSPKYNPLSEKERQQVGPGDQRSPVTEKQRLPTLFSSPSARLPTQATFSPRLISTAVRSSSSSEPSQGVSAPDPGNVATPGSNQIHIDSMVIPDKAKRLGIPLLNLDGPPEPTAQSGNASESNNSRRKRKRRKKKKALISDTGDNVH